MRFLLRKAAFLLVLLSALGTGALARAATTEQPALAEEFTLATGAVFEIYADHGIADPVYNWTLLLDDTFLQAGRNQWFRTRLIQPGNYLLTGEVRNTDGSKRYRKTLLMHVQENVPPISALSAGSGVLVRTNPAADSDGRVVLTPGRSVLQLLPVSDSQEAFVLDLQKTVDANGDGNFQNDQVAENTFFSEQHTPLHLWFAEPITRRVVTVSLRGRVGTEQEIAIVSPEQAVQEDKDRETERQRMEKERARILFTHFGSGAVKFSAYIEHEPYRRDPLLLHWNFGDGHQSLLDAPIHVYAANNVYTVRVGIRNLRTGGEIAQMETAVDVRTITPPPPPTDSNGTGEEDEPSAFSAILSTILKYGVGILFAVAIGFLATLLIRFLRRKGGVSTLLDRAEETLTDKGQKENVQEAQPMSLSIEEPQVQEAPVIETTAVDTAPPPSSQPPAAQEEQAPPDDLPTAEAPPWLQQGLGEQSAPADTETEQGLAAPPALSEEQVTPAEPVPEPPPPPEENGAVPPWLQQQPSAPMPATETAVPAAQEPEPPLSPPPPAAPSEPTGATPPPPKSETIDTANAPDWLQQGIQKAQQEGQTPSSPPPPELQKPPPAQKPAAAITLAPPPPAPSPEQKPEPSHHIPPEQWAAMTPEEREQELRRQKRRRYRQNRKMKEQAKQGAPSAPAAPVTEVAQGAVAPAEIGEPIPPAEGEDAVKFVIGADSLNPPATE